MKVLCYTIILERDSAYLQSFLSLLLSQTILSILCDFNCTLRTEATASSKTLVPVYQTMWHHIPEASNPTCLSVFSTQEDATRVTAELELLCALYVLITVGSVFFSFDSVSVYVHFLTFHPLLAML